MLLDCDMVALDVDSLHTSMIGFQSVLILGDNVTVLLYDCLERLSRIVDALIRYGIALFICDGAIVVFF